MNFQKMLQRICICFCLSKIALSIKSVCLNYHQGRMEIKSKQKSGSIGKLTFPIRMLHYTIEVSQKQQTQDREEKKYHSPLINCMCTSIEYLIIYDFRLLFIFHTTADVIINPEYFFYARIHHFGVIYSFSSYFLFACFEFSSSFFIDQKLAGTKGKV